MGHFLFNKVFLKSFIVDLILAPSATVMSQIFKDISQIVARVLTPKFLIRNRRVYLNCYKFGRFIKSNGKFF